MTFSDAGSLQLALAPWDEPPGAAGSVFAAGGTALLATRERTPPAFYEQLRHVYRPDGYLVGAGCGALAMIEAFAAAPCGIVLAERDPAGLLAARLLVHALARHPDAAGWAAELFCGGRQTLAQLERQLADGRGAEADPAARERVWTSFAAGSAGGAAPLLAALTRGYDRLHALARDGRIAVLRASPLDPALLAAVATLPRFGSTTSLVYLSDEVDQLQRRALFAAARRRLRLAAGDDDDPTAAPPIAAAADFARFISSRCEALDAACGDRPPVCVETSAARDFLLAVRSGLPRYETADLYLDFDLDRLALCFFQESGETPVAGWRAAGWRGAARLRAGALALYGAAVRGDVARAGERLAALLAGAAPRGADAPHLAAFWVAETAEALLALAGSDAAAAFAEPLAALSAILGEAARAMPPLPGTLTQAGAVESLLWAHALAAAGAALDDDALRQQARPWAAAALARQSPGGWLAGTAAEGLAAHAEALRRLVAYNRLAPEAKAAAAIRAAVPALAQPVGASGEMALAPAPPPAADGYLAYTAAPDMAYQNAYLALLFHGLAAGDLESARAALRIFLYPGRPRPPHRRAS